MKLIKSITAVAAILLISTSALAEETVNPLSLKVIVKNQVKTNIDRPESNTVTGVAKYTFGDTTLVAAATGQRKDEKFITKGIKLGVEYAFNDYLKVTQSYAFKGQMEQLNAVESMLFFRTTVVDSQGFSFDGYVQHINNIAKGGKNKRVLIKMGPSYRYGKLSLNLKTGYMNQGDYTGYYGSDATISLDVTENMTLMVGGNVYRNARNNSVNSRIVFKF